MKRVEMYRKREKRCQEMLMIFVQELTGVNLDLIERLKEDKVSTYFGSGGELDQMVEEMDEKVPDVLEQVKKLTSNADDIFQKFVDAGYIKAYQKDLIVKELTNI